MLFGLNNAPATFQRMIDSMLSNLIGKCCVVYLDDVLIFLPDDILQQTDVTHVLYNEICLSMTCPQIHISFPFPKFR